MDASSTMVVRKLDRFGLSALDVLAFIRELESAGTRFIATAQGGEAGGRLRAAL